MTTERQLRRCASDSIPTTSFALSLSPTPQTSDAESEELMEVTLDFHDDDTVVLRSIVPAHTSVDIETPAQTTNVSSSSSHVSHISHVAHSRSPSSRFRQFSQELIKSSAMAKARCFSHDLTAETLKRFSWGSSKKQAFSTPIASGGEGGQVIERAIEAREIRKKRAVMDRAWSGATLALKGLRFISTYKTNENDAWNEVQRKFDRLARDGFLSRSEFGQCIGMVRESKEFALELFDALSRRRMLKTDKICIDELLDFWSQITDESFDSRLQIFFDMVDKKGNGRITEAEVKEIIMLSASSNRLSRLKEQAEEYAALIMEELDPERFGYIELWQLETLLLQKHTYLNSQTLSYTSQSLSQNLHGFRRRGPIMNLGNKFCYYFQENWQRLWVLGLWVIIMLGLFFWKFFQYKNRYTFQIMTYCVTTAKGAAETLKLNMAIVLLPVSRNTITWLRSTGIGHCVPFNDNINFHKTIAAGIIVGIILHAGNHLACDFPRLLQTSYTEYTPLMHDFGEQKPTYMALLRGTEGVTGLLMVLLMAIAFILATRWFRRSVVKLPAPFNWITGFNSFWYSHHLLVVVYILLIIHGQCLYLVHDWYKKTTWMYLAVPLLIYAGERILRAFRSGHYSVNLRKVAIYPGDVITLQMTKPPAFKYKSGQYMFVKCPAISPFEWHPFSITSAPHDDYLSIHIRKLGDWTEELKNMFSKVCLPPLAGNSGLLRADESTKNSFPKLLIDGAYGAPAQDYRKYDVLLLVGLGIGATPFISILKDLLNNIIKSEEQADSVSCFSQNTDGSTSTGPVDSASGIKVSPKTKKTLIKTTNAYFYWVTREQGSFDWFKGVMNEIADLDQRGIIEMHNYLTSVYEEGDARSALITLVQSLNHARNGVDILSGTRVRTHFARPNWNKVFSRTCRKHPNARIGVFYCGAPVLVKELNKLCKEYNQRGSTKFELHKEHF